VVEQVCTCAIENAGEPAVNGRLVVEQVCMCVQLRVQESWL